MARKLVVRRYALAAKHARLWHECTRSMPWCAPRRSRMFSNVLEHAMRTSASCDAVKRGKTNASARQHGLVAQDMQEAALLSQRRRLLLALYAHVAHTLTPIISPHFNFSCSFLAKSLSSREYSSTYTSFVSACLSSIQSSELYYFL